MVRILDKLFHSADQTDNGEVVASSTGPIHVVDSEFQSQVLDSDLPAVVDFWAPWCMPCRMIAPVLERLASEYQGRLLVAKVNTDENPEWAVKYGVQGIPTLLFIHEGKVVDRLVGVAPAGQIRQRLERILS